MTMKKRIFITAWHPGGTNAIVPIIKALIQQSKIDVVTIGHESSETIFKKN